MKDIKYSRREFLKLGGKLFATAALFCLLPLRLRWEDFDNSKFVMKLKALRRADLYKKHNLAG